MVCLFGVDARLLLLGCFGLVCLGASLLMFDLVAGSLRLLLFLWVVLMVDYLYV